jgi:RimJ/RimL family protein N-acetyltransferase
MCPPENSSQSTAQLELPLRQALTFKPLVLLPGKLEFLWERFRSIPQAFDDVIPRTFEAFQQAMMSPQNHYYEFVLGNEVVGLAAATNVRVGLDAIMHLVMFDKRLRGRESVIKDALRDFARRARLRRMTVWLPEDNKTAIKLVQRLGFQPEGIARKAHLRDGIYRDYCFFGILAEELQDQHSNGAGPGETG